MNDDALRDRLYRRLQEGVQRVKVEEIAAIRARVEAATKGPWYAKATDDEWAMNARYVATTPGEFRHDGKLGMAEDKCASEAVVCITLLQKPRLAEVGDKRWDANTVFIARARQDIPALLQHTDAQAQRIALLEEALRPFARMVEFFRVTDNDKDEVTSLYFGGRYPLTVADLRRAAALLPNPVTHDAAHDAAHDAE